MTAYERLTDATGDMEAAIYEALERIDAYQDTVTRLLADERAAEKTNVMLVKRYEQFLAKARAMTATIEDDVVTDLLFCLDRLFAVELAEKGEFI